MRLSGMPGRCTYETGRSARMRFNTKPHTITQMSFSDEQIKDMLDMKERAIQRIEKYQKEVESLEKQVDILDTVLKQSSFTKASALHDSEKADDTISITAGADKHVIATASITAAQISIAVEESARLEENRPPFKSFFIDRIVGSMKRKDEADGAVADNTAIDCNVRTDDGFIREIIIKNYRDKQRADEIISSARWCLGKMIENRR